MSEYIDKSEAVGEGYLQDWYISSVVGDVEPVWAEDHIEELAKDFIVIPKDTPAADVVPVVHGRWIRFKETDPETGYIHMKCSVCSAYWSDPSHADHFRYCPNCGAKMDGGDNVMNTKPVCFTPEENNPYPLCTGKDMPECENCQLRAGWDGGDTDV